MALPAVLLAAALTTWTVDSGTEAVLVEDHRAAVVTVVLEFPIGSWSPWARAHHAEDAFEMSDGDPGRALKKRADALAADLSLTMTHRAATLRATCLSRDLESTLVLVRDVLANTRYDEEELKRARSEQALLWRANDTDIAFRVGQAAARSFFRSGDPRRTDYEKPERVETDVAKLVAARDALIRCPGRVVGFAGDLTPSEARRVAESLLPAAADRAPDDRAPRFAPVIPTSEREPTQDVSMRKLTQVYLSYERDSLPWTDPMRPAFLVADHVLAGHFYARLYMALRHDNGDTYGVGTSDSGDVIPGVYAATTFTRTPNAATIEQRLKDTIRRFREGGITEDERLAAIGYLGGHLAFGRQAAGQILARWMTERRLGLAPGTLDGLVERASKLSLDEINAFIGEFYDLSQFSMIRAVPKE